MHRKLLIFVCQILLFEININFSFLLQFHLFVGISIFLKTILKAIVEKPRENESDNRKRIAKISAIYVSKERKKSYIILRVKHIEARR